MVHGEGSVLWLSKEAHGIMGSQRPLCARKPPQPLRVESQEPALSPLDPRHDLPAIRLPPR